MMRKLYLLAIASACVFGCNKIETPDQADGVMRFRVDYPSTKAAGTSFEAGDKIGVYITGYESGKAQDLQLGGNYKTNNPVIYDGTKWTADPLIYWDENVEMYDVYAYYPFTIPTSVDEMPFSVELDQRVPKTQNDLSAYEASDFLYASAKKVTSAGGDVNLLFKHKMSKLTVNIVKGEDYEGDIPSAAIVQVHSTVTDCLIDLSTGDVVKNPRASSNTIIAKQVDEDTHTAIIVPQMLSNKQPLIEILFKDVSYMVESKFNFKSGTHHVINITMNRNPDKVKIEIGGEIENDWTM
jgi:hypothetical protein